MNNYNKKGQAALEFLMTYGWAILAAIIVIGALGTYFYFNQGGKDTVFIGEPFYGVASSITAGTTNEIKVEIENKGGEDVTQVIINVTGAGCIASTASDLFTSSAGPQITTLDCTAIGTGTFKGNLEVSYLRPGSQLPLQVTGSISGPIRT